MNYFYKLLKYIRLMADEKEPTENSGLPEKETQDTGTDTPEVYPPGNNGQGFPPVDVLSDTPETVQENTPAPDAPEIPEPEKAQNITTENETLNLTPMKTDEPTPVPAAPTEKKPKKPAKETDNTLLIIGVVLVVLILGAFVYWNYTRKKTQGQTDPNTEPAQPDNLEQAESQDFENTYFSPVKGNQ